MGKSGEPEWDDFFKGYREVRKKIWEKEQEIANNFNLFEVLDIERLERETHSAFLANLLDPYASHGQGPLLLIEFLKSVKEKIKGRSENKEPFKKEIEAIEGLIKATEESEPFGFEKQFTSREWDVKTEENIFIGDNSGRLDIVTRHEKTKSAIIIENKIGSKEGNDQLKKYSKWLESETGVGILLYLTLDGSTSKDSNPIELTKYHCLSYEKDIKTWLINAAKEKIIAPRVKDVVEQYLATIGKLTGEMNMVDKEITKFLKNGNNLEYALKIAECMNKLAPEIEERFWNDLKEQLEENLKENKEWGEWGVWVYNKKSVCCYQKCYEKDDKWVEWMDRVVVIECCQEKNKNNEERFLNYRIIYWPTKNMGETKKPASESDRVKTLKNKLPPSNSNSENTIWQNAIIQSENYGDFIIALIENGQTLKVANRIRDLFKQIYLEVAALNADICQRNQK